MTSPVHVKNKQQSFALSHQLHGIGRTRQWMLANHESYEWRLTGLTFLPNRETETSNIDDKGTQKHAQLVEN